MLSTRHTALCPSSSSPATGHGLPGTRLPCAQLPRLGRGGLGLGLGLGTRHPQGCGQRGLAWGWLSLVC